MTRLLYRGGLLFVVVILLGAIFIPLVSGYEFDSQNLTEALMSPGSQHWFGTDQLGRDLFVRIMVGARVSLLVGVASTFLALCVALILGSFAGLYGGWVDTLIMRMTDAIYSIPALVFLILVKFVFSQTFRQMDGVASDLIPIVLGIGMLGWAQLTRMIRTGVMQIKTFPFVESARAVGVRGPRLLALHILPQMISPLIAAVSLQIPAHILYESFLSFVGLGLKPPYSSWGVLASEGWKYLEVYPHLILAPGVAIYLTSLAFNFIGDHLRDKFDPQFG